MTDDRKPITFPSGITLYPCPDDPYKWRSEKDGKPWDIQAAVLDFIASAPEPKKKK